MEPTLTESSTQDETEAPGGVDERRRRHPRVSLSNRPPVDVTTSLRRYTAAIGNVSLGGAFIETDKIHFIGEELRLRFCLPCIETPIEVTGSVRHPYASGCEREGVGVRFEQIASCTQEKLRVCILRRLGRTEPMNPVVDAT